jgi:serine/threonine-protein kinase
MQFIATTPLPAAFQALVDADRLEEAAAASANSSDELFARGLVRSYLGREAEARSDFQAGGTPSCRLEIAFLDQRRRGEPQPILAVAEQILKDAPSDSLLAARASHLAGLIESQLRRLQPATDHLLRAVEIYEERECRVGTAQVNDSLGMVLASRGRADLAALHYALSLSDKALLGDREGLAITLGNLGRLALQQGRFGDAIAFFARDTEILQELKNARAEARLQNDLGRAHIGQEAYDKALEHLGRAKALATAGGYWDIFVMSCREAAMVELARGRLAEAAAAIAEAKSRLPADGYVLERTAVAAAEGELLSRQGEAGGLKILEDACTAFAKARLTDLEVATRVQLAAVYAQAGQARGAESALYEAMKLARAEGLIRYVRPISEALARLDLKGSSIEEAPRPISDRPNDSGTGYVIRSRLGSGGFGTVFRAFDMDAGRDVALKRIHIAALYDVGERQRLVASAKAELEAAAAIRHPGVVRVFAVGTEPNGDFYVVQEFVQGEGLQAVMARPGEKGAAEVVPFLLRIAQALDALHRAGVVHRDLKPGNIIVKGGWQPVLVDFGIAHVPSRAEVAKENLGTLQYTAPEQAAGEPAEAAADLYALGVIAYQWLTGKLPLDVPADIDAAVKMLRREDPVPLRKLRPDLPRELTDLVDQLLEKKPKKRPASASEVAERLQGLVA